MAESDIFHGHPRRLQQEGVRLLEHADAEGVLTPICSLLPRPESASLRSAYEKALRVISPLAGKYRANPCFNWPAAILRKTWPEGTGAGLL